MKLSIEDAELIVHSDHEDFEDVKGTKEITGQNRWSTFMTKVVKQLSTGKHFSIDWSQGSTECQEVDMFDYQTEVELVEVSLQEVKIMKWLPV